MTVPMYDEPSELLTNHYPKCRQFYQTGTHRRWNCASSLVKQTLLNYNVYIYTISIMGLSGGAALGIYTINSTSNTANNAKLCMVRLLTVSFTHKATHLLWIADRSLL